MLCYVVCLATIYCHVPLVDNSLRKEMTRMCTRRKSSRRDRDAHLQRPRRWLHQPRRDVKISRWDRDETFV